MTHFLSLIQKRRSIYHLGKNTAISPQNIIDTLKECLKQTPTAFNSQTGRIVLLLNKPYNQFWMSTQKILKKVTPATQFEKTKEKIASFSSGLGTILFFEEQNTIQMLQEKFPLYSDNFPVWSEQASGMLQYAVWLALTEIGLGANLQHYNPLIDTYVHESYAIPLSWKLTAQMNFGSIEKNADPKSYLDIEKRFEIFK